MHNRVRGVREDEWMGIKNEGKLKERKVSLTKAPVRLSGVH